MTDKLEMSTNQFYEKLKELNIDYTILEHNVITTMQEGIDIMKKLEDEVPVNLLLKDKSGNNYLLIKKMENKIKFNEIGKKLGLKDLKLVSQDEMCELLSVPKGCATVFSLLNDKEHKITILLDDNIKKTGKINFHPLRNNATMTIKYTDMLKFINDLGNKVAYF